MIPPFPPDASATGADPPCPCRSLLLVGGDETERSALETLLSTTRGERRILHLPSLAHLAEGYPLDRVDLTVLALRACPTDEPGALDLHADRLSQTPLILLGSQVHHRRAIEGFRLGALDWLVPDLTDPESVPGMLERVCADFERRRQEQHATELHRAVIEDQHDLICRFSPDGTLTFVSPAYARYFGKRVGELEGRSFLSVVPVSEHARIRDQLASLTPASPSHSFDHRIDTNGRITWQQWTDRGVFDSAGVLKEYQSIGRDITSRRSTEQAAHDSEMRYRALYENSPVMIYVGDGNGRLISANQSWSDTLGYTEQEAIGVSSFFFMTEDSRQVAKAELETLRVEGKVSDLALQLRHRDGSVLDLLLTATADRDADGVITSVVIVGVEITDRVNALKALEKEKERLRITLASIGDAVITTDSCNRVDYLNPTAELLTGWLNTETTGRELVEVFKPCELDSGEPLGADAELGSAFSEVRTVLLQHRHLQRSVAVDLRVAPIRDADGKVFGLVLVFRDMTESRELTERMTWQANHDELTGLVNRRAFEQRLTRVVESVSASPTDSHVLCFLDLDRFKIVNDTSGHAAGDKLLREVSSLIQSLLRERDTLARIGGDEFAILLEHCPESRALAIANTVRERIAEYHFQSAGRSFSIGVSIGLVTIDQQTVTIDAVMKAADKACYAAKDAGRNRVHVFRDDGIALQRQTDETAWVERLTIALDEDNFELFAQPIETIARNDTVGTDMELLLRLRSDDGEMIPPGAFIPAAERFQIMSRIDRWVVAHAFDWLAAHRGDLSGLGVCSINLSGQSLADRAFLPFVEAQFERTDVPFDKICFEVTEGAAIDNMSGARRFMESLRGRGCTFSLDDFGSGLSSVAYLRSLPVDNLKIDGLFVKDILDDAVDLEMVRAINEIGQILGKKTIAEFVENPEIRKRLAAMGIDQMQGFGVCKPVPLARLWRERVASRRDNDDHEALRRAS